MKLSHEHGYSSREGKMCNVLYDDSDPFNVLLWACLRHHVSNIDTGHHWPKAKFIDPTAIPHQRGCAEHDGKSTTVVMCCVQLMVSIQMGIQ